MTISLIASVDQNLGIGYKNDLLFKLPNDMKYFKELTTGNIVIMGRNTFDSIGRPLANRENVVITNNQELYIEGCSMVNELHPGWFKMWAMSQQKMFVIGGELIFNQFLPYASKIYLTVVNGDFKADRYFPKIDNDDWKITSTKFVHPDVKNKYKQAYVVLDKR